MKKIILFLMLMLVSAYSAMAGTVVLDQQALLVHQSIKSTSSVIPSFNVTGNQSLWNCQLWTNTDGSWASRQTLSSVANNTLVNCSTIGGLAETASYTYIWNVFCNGATDTDGSWATNKTFGVDLTDPSITLTSPLDFSWDTDRQVFWNITVVDNNPNNCMLYSIMNGTSNTTGNAWELKGTKAYANNTLFNFSFGQDASLWSDNGVGDYKWYVVCNDDASRSTTIGNYTVLVDATAPRDFKLDVALFNTDHGLTWINNTEASDYTPQLGWNLSADGNFSRYEVFFYKTSLWNTVYSALNVTSVATLAANITTLLADTTYQILVTAYDLAGNAKNMTIAESYYYKTDSTGHDLKAGWNIVGNTGNAFNLSEILAWTGATTVSKFATNHTFLTHVSGGSYGTEVVNAGDPVFIYVASDTNLSDLVRNTTDINGKFEYLTNQTSSDWNIVMNRATTAKNFQQIDSYLNCDTLDAGCAPGENNYSMSPYFSFHNNSANAGSKYVPYVANWSINNGTSLDYGDCVWVYFTNQSGDYLGGNLTINWSDI